MSARQRDEARDRIRGKTVLSGVHVGRNRIRAVMKMTYKEPRHLGCHPWLCNTKQPQVKGAGGVGIKLV